VRRSSATEHTRGKGPNRNEVGLSLSAARHSCGATEEGDSRSAKRYKRLKYKRVKPLRCVQVVGKASFHFLGVTRPNRLSRHSDGLSRTPCEDSKREYLRIALLIVPAAVTFQLVQHVQRCFTNQQDGRLITVGSTNILTPFSCSKQGNR
jgi:hypothetical protein